MYIYIYIYIYLYVIILSFSKPHVKALILKFRLLPFFFLHFILRRSQIIINI